MLKDLQFEAGSRDLEETLAMEDARAFERLLEGSLSCDYLGGAVTEVGDPHATGWRCLPCLVSAQVSYAVRYEIAAARQPDVAPGEVLLVAPGLRHNLTKISPGVGVSRWSHASFHAFTAVDLFTLIEPPRRISDPGRAAAIGAINAGLAGMGEAVHDDAAALQRAVARKAWSLELLRLIVEVSTLRPGALHALRAAQRLAPVLSAIDSDLAHPPRSVAELSASASLSRSRLQALFHEAFAVSPMRYVRLRRLDRSLQLLVATDHAIGSVAVHVGFTDQFHFSRAFKAAYGCGPAAFRQRMRRSTT